MSTYMMMEKFAEGLIAGEYLKLYLSSLIATIFKKLIKLLNS